ncbi:hypothetical protein KIW84_011347 [Lathyrus oleraceus]|uniref:Bifunctional inhibitor/plant lipid transfer protein/seed storage helical domain-containing protein n=1 Tax=Pisum sativum TaxID=3888 RepID=A0A9D4YQD3_PEA|nr:hypothetical protein KIW84_011347 [Pisum sativum]
MPQNSSIQTLNIPLNTLPTTFSLYKRHIIMLELKAINNPIESLVTTKRRMKKHSMCRAFVVAVVVVLLGAHMGEALTCSPVELSTCLGSITRSSPPSTVCCQKAREQRPCLCGYLKNPSLKRYVYTPGAKRVAKSCGIPFPPC